MAKYVTGEIILGLYTNKNKKNQITEKYPFYYYISSNDDILPASSNKYMFKIISDFMNKCAKSMGVNDVTKFTKYLFPDKLIFRHNSRDIKTIDKSSDDNGILYGNYYMFSMAVSSPSRYNYIDSLLDMNNIDQDIDDSNTLIIQENIIHNKNELVKYLEDNIINSDIKGIKYKDLVFKYSDIRYIQIDLNQDTDKRLIIEQRSYELNILNYINIYLVIPADNKPYIQRLECFIYNTNYNISHIYNLSSISVMREDFSNKNSSYMTPIMNIFIISILALFIILAIKGYYSKYLLSNYNKNQ